MKKNITIILSSILFAFCAEHASAMNMPTEYDATYTVTRTDTAKLPLDRVIEIHDTLQFDNILELHEELRSIDEAPSITIIIYFPIIKSLNKNVSKNIEKTLTSIIFDQEEKSLNEATQEFCRKCKNDFIIYINEFIKDIDNNLSFVFYNFFYGITADVESGWNGYINYTVTQEVYEGGAHPNSYKSTIIFNPIDGNRVTLDDILKPGYKEALTTLLTAKLFEQNNVRSIQEAQDAGFFIYEPGVPIPSNYTFGNNGITFIYNTYEIASYASGEINLTLTYNELKDLLK